jgi:integrase
VLRPIWEEKTVTAKKIRGRLEDVFSWAIVKGYFRGDNPARWKNNLKEILPMPSRVHKTQHLRALDVNDAPEFMALLRTKQGTAPRALEFLILTAVRSLEVRGTRWAELDLERQRWEIPGERMKMNRPHVVPLSDAALNLLQQTPEFSPEFVFPAPRGGMLTDSSLMAVIKRMDWYDRTTVHGFRAVFKSWANEIVDAPDFVSEMALAHSVGDSIQKAYKRSNLFAKRLKLMREWAQFLGYAEKGAKVVPLEARA